MEDKQIIELYFSRSQEAITRTEEKYGTRLLRYADSILRNKEDSEECVNDTYLKAWDIIPPNRPHNFYAFLAKICRFFAFGKLDYKNAEKRSAKVVELSAEMEMCIPNGTQTPQEQFLEQQILIDLLERFLYSLPREKRMIFMRRYWHMESIEEIASHFSISESKVKSILFRLRKQLKKYLEKEGVSL